MLGGTLSTSPAQFTTIVASMFVNNTKTTLRAHTVDKNTSSVCRSKRRFRPKPHAPVLFLSIYRDTVPLKVNGESGDVQGETVDSWKERLPEILHGYDKDDVWNMDGPSSPFLKVCFIQDRRM